MGVPSIEPLSSFPPCPKRPAFDKSKVENASIANKFRKLVLRDLKKHRPDVFEELLSNLEKDLGIKG